MKYAFLILPFLFLVTSCDSTEEECMTSTDLDLSEKYSFFSDNSIVDGTYYDITKGQLTFDSTTTVQYAVEEGPNIVFVYRDIIGSSTDRIDDELESRLLFEVDSSVESFVFDTDTDFEMSNCTYGYCGAWFGCAVYQEFEGSITGERTSNCDWDVSIDLIVASWGGSSDTIKVNAVFSN